tara:strand:+ start:19285 stop:19767 length:483 start_codon:yes stop_codon:yes gene_type:complete
MTIQIGDNLPEGSFNIMLDDKPSEIDTRDLFGNKNILLFAVPGAFTPGCSLNHLPGFVSNRSELYSKGIEQIFCLAVNDIFVMSAWAKSQNISDEIIMISDGNCDYTKKIGLEIDSTAFGMGIRSRRYALVANDSKITQLFIDEPGKIEVSTAESVLSNL